MGFSFPKIPVLVSVGTTLHITSPILVYLSLRGGSSLSFVLFPTAPKDPASREVFLFWGLPFCRLQCLSSGNAKCHTFLGLLPLNSPLPPMSQSGQFSGVKVPALPKLPADVFP